MRIHVGLASAIAVLLGACAQPLVTPNPPTFQAKATHVADWSALASRTAGRFSSVAAVTSRPVYVAPGPADMPFASAYRKLLEHELHDRGIRVVEDATGATVLRFDVQAFWYRDENRKQLVDYATFWTAAYAIGQEARHVASIDTGAAIVGGAGPILDLLAELNNSTKAEVVLSLTVMDGPELAYRDSETIYIRPNELPFYWTRVPDFVPQSKPAVGQNVAFKCNPLVSDLCRGEQQ